MLETPGILALEKGCTILAYWKDLGLVKRGIVRFFCQVMELDGVATSADRICVQYS